VIRKQHILQAQLKQRLPELQQVHLSLADSHQHQQLCIFPRAAKEPNQMVIIIMHQYGTQPKA
jgi:hypothetical protein